MLESESEIRAHLNQLAEEPIAHGSSVKKVFINKLLDDSNLTQFAFGSMDVGESCELHFTNHG